VTEVTPHPLKILVFQANLIFTVLRPPGILGRSFFANGDALARRPAQGGSPLRLPEGQPPLPLAPPPGELSSEARLRGHFGKAD